MMYRIGIDVGTNSIGFAAIEVDEHGMPIQFLNSMVLIHDSGVDPNQNKKAITRLATAGTARRTRRLVQRRRKRLQDLDKFIEKQGWPLPSFEELRDPISGKLDPHAPWKIRARLAEERLEGEELTSALSIALRHIARHRGWRSPYIRVESLHLAQPDSDQLKALRERVKEISGVESPEGSTPAQVIRDLGIFEGGDFHPTHIRLRDSSATYKKNAVRNFLNDEGRLEHEDIGGKTKQGILGGKLMQSDNANEIRAIGKMQGLSDELVNEIIDIVFKAESPKGKAGERAGKDELPGMRGFTRAPKAHLAFQRFRIVSVVANLRIREAGVKRILTADEKQKVIDFLMAADGSDGVTWNDVAEVLEITRQALSGTADGERSFSFPPVNVTNERIITSKVKPLVTWWKQADDIARGALITALSNADELTEDEPGAEEAREFLETLSDEELDALDSKLKLPAGRAAYSPESLERLTNRMLADSVDLFEARKREFNVPNDWAPTPDPIGAPVGNPAVDRVLKGINRWLMAVVHHWGAPEVVNIEHVRSAFGSERMAREYERAVGKRFERNRAVIQEMHDKLGIKDRTNRSDITRYLAIQRQNSQCAYCGTPITYFDSEMDHIVPRKGIGSTNTRDNLVAACSRCNRSKSNLPFAVWAATCGIPEVSVGSAVERVKFWIDDPGLDRKQNRNFKSDVISRLQRTEADEELDNRSIESVAWMAVEVHDRIAGYFAVRGDDVTVNVFRGAITASARKASGFEGKVELIGGNGKTRLDRRHHAMDAATIALMRQSVATTLVERDNIRDAQRYTTAPQTWKDYRGSNDEQRYLFGTWRNAMNRLVVMFNDALRNDEIPVMENLRLRLGSSEAHDATIKRLHFKRIGDAWTLKEIDRASSEAMWCALTRLPDFDSKEGLPENPDRELRVKNQRFGADDKLGLFGSDAAAIAVRGGYAEIGGTIHHARIYRINGKKPSYGMVRVFSCDLQKHRKEDLFSVELKPQTISMRTADPKVRKAITDGTAEYLGWLVVGDELRLDLHNSKFHVGEIGVFLDQLPVTAWRINGFPMRDRFRLRPVLLAGEGLKNLQDCDDAAVKILDGRGWIPAVNVIMSYSYPSVIRRGVLGNTRHASNSLPQTMTFG